MPTTRLLGPTQITHSKVVAPGTFIRYTRMAWICAMRCVWIWHDFYFVRAWHWFGMDLLQFPRAQLSQTTYEHHNHSSTAHKHKVDDNDHNKPDRCLWTNTPVTQSLAMQSCGRSCSPPPDLVFSKLNFPRVFFSAVCFFLTDTGGPIMPCYSTRLSRPPGRCPGPSMEERWNNKAH